MLISQKKWWADSGMFHAGELGVAITEFEIPVFFFRVKTTDDFIRFMKEIDGRSISIPGQSTSWETNFFSPTCHIILISGTLAIAPHIKVRSISDVSSVISVKEDVLSRKREAMSWIEWLILQSAERFPLSEPEEIVIDNPFILKRLVFTMPDGERLPYIPPDIQNPELPPENELIFWTLAECSKIRIIMKDDKPEYQQVMKLRNFIILKKNIAREEKKFFSPTEGKVLLPLPIFHIKKEKIRTEFIKEGEKEKREKGEGDVEEEETSTEIGFFPSEIFSWWDMIKNEVLQKRGAVMQGE